MSGSDRKAKNLLQGDELLRHLKSLPARTPPESLTVRLRVTASQEAVRRRTRVSLPVFWRHLLGLARLRSHNLMRPLAIPTAGGFVSALLLFAMLAPGLMVQGSSISATSNEDVPTGLYTGASLRSFVPLDFTHQEVDIELTIDGQGRIVDYEIPNGRILKCPALRRAIEKNLLFTQFNPATSFGQPMTGKVRLSFRTSRIDVKG